MSEDQNVNDVQQENSEQKQKFKFHKIYVKEQSCKVPNAPDIFKGEWKPEVTTEMKVKNDRVSEDSYEVSLNLNVTAKLNNRTAYVVEVNQSGIVSLEGFNDEQLRHLLSAFVPGQLYAYAQKTISGLVTDAGFGAFVLTPINFDALYQQQLQQSKEKQESEASEDTSYNSKDAATEVVDGELVN